MMNFGSRPSILHAAAACLLAAVSPAPPVPGGAGTGAPPLPAVKSAGKDAALFTLPGDAALQEFTASPDLVHWALVYTGRKVSAHLEGKPKTLKANATVVHDATVVGSYPDVAPFSLRLSEGGTAVAFTVVKWRSWTVPLYWVVRNGTRFTGNGYYTEEVEFHELSHPWLSPDGSRVAYLLVLKGKRRIMVDETAIFTSKDARLTRPWSPDGKQVALIARKDGEDKLVVDGKTTASAADIRLLRAPSTYIAREGGEDALVVDGKPCARHAAIQGAVFSASGGRIALSVRDDGGRAGVLLLDETCKVVGTWGEDGWTDILSIRLSDDGKRLFYAARTASGTLTASLEGPEILGCGPDIDFDSVAITSGPPEATAWTVPEAGGQVLCIDGKPSGRWDRIELPLAFSPDGSKVLFHAWKDDVLFLASAPL
jgi:hypothetical protein